MATHTWEYGSLAAGLQFTITYDDAAEEFTVTSQTGSFDLNALWFSDGNSTSDGYTLVKSDNSLNMNGTNIVWDDGTSSSQTIVWDDYAKLSKPGGGNVQDKIGFISEGETQTFTLAALGVTTFDPTTYDTLGVRATSVNGNGEIKWADTTPEIDEGPGGGTTGRIVYSAPGAGDFDVFAFTFGVPAAGGPVILAPLLTGTFQVVNNGAGDQIDPHVSGNIASYTDDQAGEIAIRYYDFVTNTDQAVPTTGAAFLSDIDGTRIVHTQVSLAGSQIGLFNTADETTFIIPGGTQRTDASIGGLTVAFEDRSFSANPNESEIVVYDLATNTTTRLTNDALLDINPQVSADGNVIVFQKAATTGTGSDIWVSVQTSPGVFTTSAITGSLGEDIHPTTNGSVVAYASTRGGETDIYFQPVGGGAEVQLALAGVQRNPSMSGDQIAFESNESGGQFDIYLYDMAAATLYQVTNTPVDETLNDYTAFPADFIV
jgi:hypothetical protein